MKRLLVINYPHMLIGGIEDYIYHLMKQQIDNGVDIMWLCDVSPKIAKEYEDIILSSYVKRIAINTHGLHWSKHESIEFDGYDQVAILSFCLFDHLRAYEITRDKKEISLMYYVPHFKGGKIFSDEYSPKICRKFYHNLVANFYNTFDNDGSLRYFSKEHREQIRETYGLNLDMSTERLIPEIKEKMLFDEARCSRVFHKPEKTILSVTRFEFPHKGFLLGLIKDFEKISKSYEDVVLKIVGYGADEVRVMQAIESLPIEVQKKVHLVGQVAPEKLDEYYKDAYMNVSVAGCAILGAKNSVVTLSPRHYCEKCEVHGFLSKSLPDYLSDKPGESIFPYIEKLMQMSEAEYESCCKASYEAILQRELDPDYIFSNKVEKGSINSLSMLAVKILALYKKFSFKLKYKDKI